MMRASQTKREPVVDPTTGSLIIPPIEPGSLPGALGRPYSKCTLEEIRNTERELTSKIAWAIGSTYGVPYSKRASTARAYAARCAVAIERDHGYL